MKGLVNTLEERPYVLLWMFSIFFLAIYIFTLFLPEQLFDLNVHDTYIVIAFTHLLILPVIWFGLCGLGYYVMLIYRIKPVYWLTLLHLLITILAVILLCFPNLFTMEDNSLPELNIPMTVYKVQEYEIKMVAFLILAGAQILYFINILISALIREQSGKG